MDYQNLIESKRNDRLNKIVAGAILKDLNEVRNKRETASRRWIWELIQNAKDSANNDEGISIELCYEISDVQSYIEFKHNGGHFSLDNIEDLIEKDSSKRVRDANAPKSKKTGKFGTGFLTTHLLSEKVLVKGFVEEPDKGLRYFEVPLDRTGQDELAITRSLKESMEALIKYLDDPSNKKTASTGFNTSFRYELDEKGRYTAKIGLSDMHIVLPYVLVFLPQIEFLSLMPEAIFYRKMKPVEISSNISIEQIDITTPKSINIDTRKFLVNRNEEVAILVEIDAGSDPQNITVLSIDDTIPRLFCDFPLIGTEDFPFPVIVNSHNFNPTEPRDGIWLTDPEIPIHVENRSLLIRASELYLDLLQYLSGIDSKNLHHML